ncbi:MAG: T9SS type A sorting domain-containing protein, partial [Bacteroidota bacterium]
IYIIDHSPSTEEAAGPAGDFLYRWGNPQAYQRGDSADQVFFGQHDVQWIPEGHLDAGKLLVFNNGRWQETPHSSVVMLDPPLDSAGHYSLAETAPYGPDSADWTYTAPEKTDFYAYLTSSAQRLPNNNILVCEGPLGRLFEITPKGEEVWRYVSPATDTGVVQQGVRPRPLSFAISNFMFRTRRYPLYYSGFEGRDLSPKGPIERSPWRLECEGVEEKPLEITLFPNPVAEVLTIQLEEIFGHKTDVVVRNIHGQIVWSAQGLLERTEIDVRTWESGLYFVQFREGPWFRLMKL